MPQAKKETDGLSLRYKPDWDETRQRYVAWWRGEKLDRCLIFVTAPREELRDEPPQGASTIEEYWTDLDYWAAINDYQHRHTFYGGEAFPLWNVGYPGHATIPTFYGCPFALSWDTGWHQPILLGQRLDVSGLKLDRDGRWWRFGDESLQRARRESAGKSIPSMHAIFGGGDTLGMLRGNERLMFDLMDDPAGVRQAELKLMDDWELVFRHQADLLKNGDDWYGTWFPLWAPGYFYPMHCDVSYGISPRSFRECFVPALRRQAEFLDFSIYHLDGEGAFPLVEEVCRIEAVGGVQVLPGAGKPSPLHYLDVLRTVQRMGKRLHISIGPEEVPQALELLSARGLCIHTSAATESQARALVEQAEKLSRER